jgi:DNA-binding response OmpR family regulator
VSQPQTILVVEDETSIASFISLYLKNAGYNVRAVTTGGAALTSVVAETPSLVILDLNLPGIDGYNVLTQLRSRPATRAIPVVVLTAKGDEDNEVRVFELGADDFITKPFRAKALSARLEAVLGRHRA